MKFNITQKELKNLSAFCANKSRPQLEHITATVKAGRLELFASDGGAMAILKKDVEGAQDGEQTVVPSNLYKKFNSKAHIEISSTDTKNTYRAVDLVSGQEIFYTVPENRFIPNYDLVVRDLETAKTAENFAIFSHEHLKKLETLIGWQYYQNITPVTRDKSHPHFWVLDDLIVALMPYRA